MSSAHCLRFNDSWWDMFSMNPATMHYEIAAVISGPGVDEPYNLTMDQSTPFFVNENGTLSGTIIGDFPSPTAYPTFESYNLAIQRFPLASSVVRGGVPNWMMIPTDMIDYTGQTCNKIGVSFEGFYAQSQRCSVVAGSCLYNQLDSLYSADDLLRQAGHTPTYLIQRWGAFDMDIDTSKQFDLTLLPNGIQNTLLTLNIKADAIRFITNRSTGVIAAATIGNFITFTQDGVIYVVAVNTGSLTSQYILTVTTCTTPGVLPVPAQEDSIAPLDSWNTTFQIFSQNLFSSKDSCTVSLYDSVYNLLDQVIVYFNTTAYVQNEGSQGGNNTLAPSNAQFLDPSSITCRQKCPSFWDIPCFLVEGCWISILEDVAVVVACIVLVFLLIKTRFCITPVNALSKTFCRKALCASCSNDDDVSPKPRRKSRHRHNRKSNSKEDSHEDDPDKEKSKKSVERDGFRRNAKNAHHSPGTSKNKDALKDKNRKADKKVPHTVNKHTDTGGSARTKPHSTAVDDGAHIPPPRPLARKNSDSSALFDSHGAEAENEFEMNVMEHDEASSSSSIELVTLNPRPARTHEPHVMSPAKGVPSPAKLRAPATPTKPAAPRKNPFKPVTPSSGPASVEISSPSTHVNAKEPTNTDDQVKEHQEVESPTSAHLLPTSGASIGDPVPESMEYDETPFEDIDVLI